MRDVPAGAALALAMAGVVAFVLGLGAADGLESSFAAALLCLVVAAATGPFAFGLREDDRRWTPAARAALRCGAFGLLAALACGVVALARGGPVLAALSVGLFCGLYAFATGAVAHVLGGGVMRVVAGAAALALLATLLVWDDLFLLDAADRKASAALAFELNAAGAASVTLGFDWLHAPELYRDNETAESMVGVALPGIGAFGLRLAGLSAAATVLGLWRRP